MTHPQSAQQPINDSVQIIAAAVAGLALVALEARIREEIEAGIEAVFETAIGLLLVAVAAGSILTGAELFSLPMVYKGLKNAFARGKEKMSNSIESGYAAGAQIALTKAQRDMKKIGHEVSSTMPNLGSAVEVLTSDLDLAFEQAFLDLQNSVREAFDGVQGDNATAARMLVMNKAAERVASRLVHRAQATAGVAVHRGASDAQNAIYDNFINVNPYVTVRKRWRVTASDPCAMCSALHGAEVNVRTEFDHNAGGDSKDWRPVWRNLQGPPRHPNCRCQLELVTS